MAYSIDLQYCRKAVEANRIDQAVFNSSNGSANLYGKAHPQDQSLYAGTSAEDVNQYLLDSQLELQRKLNDTDPDTRQVISLPGMCQFRTTRCIEGDYVLKLGGRYRQAEDSVTAINDFEHRDVLMEIPCRALVRTGFDNLMTAGRCALGTGYAWDMIRVIPSAIITGQAAGLAEALSLASGKPIYGIDKRRLQSMLTKQNVMLHFDDAWVPAEAK